MRKLMKIVFAPQHSNAALEGLNEAMNMAVFGRARLCGRIHWQKITARYVLQRTDADGQDLQYCRLAISATIESESQGEQCMKILKLLALTMIAAFAIAACDSDDGMAEKAGAAMDDVGDKMGDAMDNAGDKMGEVAGDVGNAIEDACEDVKKGVDAKDTDC